MKIQTIEPVIRQAMPREPVSKVGSASSDNDGDPKMQAASVGAAGSASARPVGAVQTKVAVSAMNEVLKAADTNLKFQVDDETGMVVVKLVDQDTGKVLRQIPSDEMLRMARAIDRMTGRIVDATA